MRVLFVEDNVDVRELVGLLLEEEGLDVVLCASAEAALAAFDGAAAGFDALLTDVSLPAMSGTELARQLRPRKPQLWVVFSSGYDMAHGVAEFGPRTRSLRKPFEIDELARLVAEIRADLVTPATASSQPVGM